MMRDNNSGKQMMIALNIFKKKSKNKQTFNRSLEFDFIFILFVFLPDKESLEILIRKMRTKKE